MYTDIKDVASNIITIVKWPFKGHNFEMNHEMIKQYLIAESLGIYDCDGGFESAIEGLIPEHEMSDEKRLDKAIDICREYIVQFMQEGQEFYDRLEDVA
jgi:hypothetical protein